jgi:hypothetical protein
MDEQEQDEEVSIDEAFQELTKEDKKARTPEEKRLSELISVINLGQLVKKAQEDKLLDDDVAPTKLYKKIVENYLPKASE